MKIPDIVTAQNILREAEKLNPGTWTDHSRIAASCAKSIAKKCNLNADYAFVLGLLHDIGRREGVTDMRHIIDGYVFLKKQNYDDAARICLTHSFPYKNILSYNGENDCTLSETQFIADFIRQTEYDDYDRLIQLCDAYSSPSGAVIIERRLINVALRRGINEYTVEKWRAFLELREYFEQKCEINTEAILGL